MKSKNKAPTCTDCGTTMWPVIYGLPSAKLFKAKHVILGGCIIEPNAPEWQCPNEEQHLGTEEV